jgi:undecaprenyl-diphosphatase
MDSILIAVILGIVEGVTEFLPISSTGHLILFNSVLGFTGAFANAFDVIIQLGAILSVVVYFRKKILLPFLPGREKKGDRKDERKEASGIWKKVIVGMVPAVLIAGAAQVLLGSGIEDALFNPVIVASALLVGGVALILLERRKVKGRFGSIQSITYQTAFLIGLIQCLALVPGTSRSAATIIGAMLLGATRIAAAEFSFYLAIPTLAAASAYSMWKIGFALSASEVMLLSVGFVVSFIVAWAVIAGFMGFIKKRDFSLFGYYRIVLGLLVLAYFWLF